MRTTNLIFCIGVVNTDIKILGRAKAVKLSYTDFENTKAIISISDPFSEPAKFNKNNRTVKNILYLSFYDIDEDTKSIFKGFEPMTYDDAIKIADFVKNMKDKVESIWINCEVGVSRSAGVALAIAEYLNIDTTQILNSETYRPNKLCYELTKRALKQC